jgi:hypothetical protein
LRTRCSKNIIPTFKGHLAYVVDGYKIESKEATILEVFSAKKF